MLSYARIAWLHFGHAEAGSTIDFPLGIRRMQTLRKLPMIKPKRNTNAEMSASGATSRMCHKLRPLSSAPSAPLPDF